MNPGYIIIDCEGLDLTKGSTPQEIDGLYAKCQAAIATGKPVIAANLKWGTIPASPMSVMLIQLYEDTVTATAATLQIVVTDDDSVVINNLVAG